MATSTPRIFVSHSHYDNDFGLRLIADLRRDLGDEDAVWYDVSGGLHGGVAWWRTIVREITARGVFLVVLSPDAVASKWVEDEIDLAWAQKNSPTGKTIIPVLYRECDIRADLKTRQMVSFVAPKGYDAAYKELLASLNVMPSAPLPFPPHPQRQSKSTHLRSDGLDPSILLIPPHSPKRKRR
jgi:TIR domain